MFLSVTVLLFTTNIVSPASAETSFRATHLLSSKDDEIADLLNSYEGVVESALDYVEHTAAWWERRYEAVRKNVEDARDGDNIVNDGPNLQSTVGELGSCIGWRQTADCSPHGVRQPMFDRGCTEAIPDGVSGYCQCGDPTTSAVSSSPKNAKKPVPFNGGEWQGPGVGCLHKPFTCKAMCQLRRDAPKKEVLATYQSLERNPSIPQDEGSTYSSSEGVNVDNTDITVVVGDDGEAGLGERAPTVDIRSARERLIKAYGHLIFDEFDVESTPSSSSRTSEGSDTGAIVTPTVFSERQQIWQTSLDNTNFGLYPRRSVLHRYLSHAEERSRLSTMRARIKVAMATRPGTPIDENGVGIPPSFLQEQRLNEAANKKGAVVETVATGGRGGDIEAFKGSSSRRIYRNPVDTVADVRRRVEMESSLRRLHRALHHASEDDPSPGEKAGHHHHHHHHHGSDDNGDTEDLIYMLRSFELEYNLPFKGGLEEISASKKDATQDNPDAKKMGGGDGGANTDTNLLLRSRRSAWDTMKRAIVKDLHADPTLLNLLLLSPSTNISTTSTSSDVELATSKLTYVDAFVLGSMLDKIDRGGDGAGAYDTINGVRNKFAESLSKSRMEYVGRYLDRREAIRIGVTKSFLGKNIPYNEDSRLVGLREERADFEDATKADCSETNDENSANGRVATQGGVDAVLNAGIGGIDGDRQKPDATSTSDTKGWCYRSRHGAHYRRAWAHLLDDVFNDGGGGRAHIPLPPSLQGPSAFELDDYVDSMLFGPH